MHTSRLGNLVIYCIQGEALQNNDGRTSGKLNSGGFETKTDTKEKEGNGDFQGIAEEPEDLLDNASKNTPQGSNQEGMDLQNITKHKHKGAKS